MRRPAVWPAVDATATASRPLPAGSVVVSEGLWHRRRDVNARVTLAHGLEQLRRSGTVDNFVTLVEGREGAHGHVDAIDGDVKNFVDSDVYKWLEAVAWSSVGQPVDHNLMEEASQIVDVVVAAQAPDGYLNTWFQRVGEHARFSNLPFGHELYCLGHLIQAGIAWHRALADRRLLDVARRFADLVIRRFGMTDEVCGHPCIEMALVELSRETGDARYRDMAATFIDRRGHGTLGPGRFGAAYYQDDEPYRQMRTLSGHAVRAVYLAAGAVDVAVECEDEELLAASRRQWNEVVRSRLHITGGIGSRHLGEAFGEDFELASDAAYCETCASIGLAMWTWRLSLTSPDGAYGDVIERALLNTVLAGVAADGRSFRYTNPLDVHRAHPRQEWFEIACCPPNAMRILATVDQLVASENDAGILVHQYIPSRIDAGRSRAIELTSAYPAEGEIRMRITESPGETWTLSLRIPAWAHDVWSITVNGTVAEVATENGFARLSRVWRIGDLVTLTLPVEPRMTQADPRTVMAGTVVVERGPVVYALDGESLDTLAHDVMLTGVLTTAMGRVSVEGLPLVSATVAPVEAPDKRTVAALCPFAHTGPGERGYRTWLPLARATSGAGP